MIDKRVASSAEALRGLADGQSVMVSGFGDAGMPFALVDAVLETGATDLTLISNNTGTGERGVAALFREGRVRRVLCSYPRNRGSIWFERRFAAGQVELELVPQGTLSERIRAGGAGIAAFFTPTGAGTRLAEGKETRTIGGVEHVLEHALRADFALVRAETADRWGNLTYRGAARNYGPTMATAADVTVAEVSRYVELGATPPEAVVTPGVLVDRLVLAPTALEAVS